MLYQKILLAGFMPEGEPGPLPNELIGLEIPDLTDLTWTSTEFRNYGYWPVSDTTELPFGYELDDGWEEISVDRIARNVTAKRNIRPVGLDIKVNFVQSLAIEQGSGKGIRFWDGNPDLSIYVADANDGNWGGRVLDEKVSAKNLYLKTSGRDGWVFRNGASNVAGIDHEGNFRIRGVAYVTQPNNSWLKSIDGVERIYFVRGGRTIIKSGDGSYELRNSADTEMMSILPSGDMSIYGTLKTGISKNNSGIWIGNSGDIVDLGDHFASMRFAGGVKVYSGNKGGSAVITLGSDGTITTTGTIVGQSDRRTKTDITPLQNSLELARALLPSRFTHNGSPGIGFIAQDVQDVLPELVVDKDGFLHVNYQQMVAVAIGAIQDLSEKIRHQDEKISYLEDRLRDLENLVFAASTQK